MVDAASQRARTLVIVVAALGYFVDIYDLILFNVVRLPSLRELGVTAEAMLDTSTHLLGVQMLGMLVGGIVWGILGDRRGRLSVLFASIVLYSLANLANGLVHDLDAYAALRFVAGVGLAGEIGAGITLVSEVMDKRHRGTATTIVATVGICGAVAASLIGGHFHWLGRRDGFLSGPGFLDRRLCRCVGHSGNGHENKLLEC